jgi:hypothetical protein
MPSIQAAIIDTIKKARKGLNFAQVISSIKAMMQRRTVNSVMFS